MEMGEWNDGCDGQKIRAFQRGVLADLRGKYPPLAPLGHKHDTEEKRNTVTY